MGIIQEHKDALERCRGRIAALEAELDEARVAATKYKAAHDELAARLRAVGEAVAALLDPKKFGTYEYMEGTQIHADADAVLAALSGDLPPCAGCGDRDETLSSIAVYGSDTLSGNAEGPSNAQWFRDGVAEMVRRASQHTDQKGAGNE